VPSLADAPDFRPEAPMLLRLQLLLVHTVLNVVQLWLGQEQLPAVAFRQVQFWVQLASLEQMQLPLQLPPVMQPGLPPRAMPARAMIINTVMADFLISRSSY
jgi:hypothetical protein